MSGVKKTHREKGKLREKKRITARAYTRLARRAGVLRVSKKIYKHAAHVSRSFLESVLRDCLLHVELAKRKTVTTQDVLVSLRRQGVALYGYE